MIRDPRLEGIASELSIYPRLRSIGVEAGGRQVVLADDPSLSGKAARVTREGVKVQASSRQVDVASRVGRRILASQRSR